MPRLPKWIRCSTRTDDRFASVSELIEGSGLRTVCRDAQCPNRLECWNSGTATVMILGEKCTRSCTFCAVEKGEPEALDRDEPRRVIAAAKEMGVRHLVITSVTRDDLDDGGASVFAECIARARRELPQTTVEVLVPDFNGSLESLDTVLEAGPAVLNHNIETVERLQSQIRRQASYDVSLSVLRRAAERGPPMAVKSGIMVGMGETDDEVYRTLGDLHSAGCRLLTIGQYLAPSRRHWPVERYVEPHIFEEYARRAREIGFIGVASAPLVRSSYMAADMMAALREVAQDAC